MCKCSECVKECDEMEEFDGVHLQPICMNEGYEIINNEINMIEKYLSVQHYIKFILKYIKIEF